MLKEAQTGGRAMQSRWYQTTKAGCVTRSKTKQEGKDLARGTRARQH